MVPVKGELTNPETLVAAAAGVDAVFRPWPGFDPAGADRAAAALAGRGAHVVYLSAVRLVAPQAGRSIVHERDRAEVAVAALLDPAAHAGRAYVVTGPQSLTQAEQVAGIAARSGWRSSPHDDAVRERRGLGMAAAEQAAGYWVSLVDRPERVSVADVHAPDARRAS